MHLADEKGVNAQFADVSINMHNALIAQGKKGAGPYGQGHLF